MIEGVGKDVPDWKVLIVDPKTLRIISSACRMYDVMEKGITGTAFVCTVVEPLNYFSSHSCGEYSYSSSALA